jgi:hypothetical protein
MSEPILSALVQAPFVLVMAYLVQRFLANMAQRDHDWQQVIQQIHQSQEAIADRMDSLVQAVDGLSDRIMRSQPDRSSYADRNRPRSHSR